MTVLVLLEHDRGEPDLTSWQALTAARSIAHVLGSNGVPNRVDPWGPDRAHDWPLWREMLPDYLEQML